MRLYADPSVTRDVLDSIASELDIQVYEYDELGHRVRGKFSGKTAHKFLLRPVHNGRPPREQRFRKINDAPYGGGDGRRAAFAVCWHGHFFFMAKVFEHDPSATFQTGFDTWAGQDDFFERAPASGTRNVGSIMHPLSYQGACDCDMTGDYIIPTHPNPPLAPASDTGGVKTWVMQQSMIKACPHFILVPDHYRADGSCRCYDPTATVMAEWGYRWDGSQWVGDDSDDD
jgi:hypothetical protein